MNYTQKLAEFCAGLSYHNLPAAIVDKAKLCLLDYVANVYGSLELDAVRQLVDYIKTLETGGTVTVLGCGFKSDLHHAAFINGTTAEAIEAQDGVRFGGNHPGVAVLPACLAIAEKEKLNGKKIIEAITVGYEAANRPAAAMHPWHTLSGFLPTGTCGAFGAAAAFGKLYGFDQDTMASALGNAGYLLPLSMAEHLMGGFTIKITQGGQGALAGLMAAGLAGKGITGAPYVLEGSALNGGFTRITTGGNQKPERIVDNLGSVFSLADVYFKPYTACRHTHGAAQAVLELVREHAFSPDQIATVDVFTYGIAQLAVGKGITAESSFVAAQFSIPYVVAVCLIDKELGPRQLTEKRLQDSSLLALAKKVTIQSDKNLDAVYPDKTSSRVRITLADGTMLEKQIDIPKGDPRDPMTVEDIVRKVKLFAGERNQTKVQRVCEMILDLENLDTITELVSLI